MIGEVIGDGFFLWCEGSRCVFSIKDASLVFDSRIDLNLSYLVLVRLPLNGF